MSLFDELKQNPLYDKVIKELSKEEREEVEKNMKQFMDDIDSGLNIFLSTLGKTSDI